MAHRPPQSRDPRYARSPRSMGRYSCEPPSSQPRWSGGFYTGEDRDQRAREYAERPHGWGNYEANYGVARGEPRRVDAPARADHAGKGPKNYRRSDQRTRELVCELLTDDPDIDATDIDVQIREGDVVLSGSVPDRRMKYAAEDLAERCAHGTEVRNELTVQRRDDTPSSTAE